jgi:Flp pilus assembly protein TadB
MGGVYLFGILLIGRKPWKENPGGHIIPLEERDGVRRMYEKSILKSKTFWFNALAFVAVLVTAMVDAEIIPPMYAALAIAAANIVLRAVTDTAVYVPEREDLRVILERILKIGKNY